MSTEIATRPETAVMNFDPEKLDVLKQTIAKGVSNTELSLFVEVCKRTRLDPFARQIYAVMRYDGKAKKEVMSIQTSIDGFRLIAERSGVYAGQKGPFWTADGKTWVDVWLEKAPPKAAKVAVLRRDFAEPLWAVATWDQYAQTYYKDGKTNLSPMWAKMPALMIAKVAEALALRKAFPNDLSGLYTGDEMAQAEKTDLPVESAHVVVSEPKQEEAPRQRTSYILPADEEGEDLDRDGWIRKANEVYATIPSEERTDKMDTFISSVQAAKLTHIKAFVKKYEKAAA